MKRIIGILLLLVILCGCREADADLDPVLSLREKILNAGCSFDAAITADYGDKTYTFAMGCTVDTHGNLSFEVKSPETLTGIRGSISGGEGQLRFADTALAFPLLADGQLSPVSAPWVLTKALRSGYIAAVGADGEFTRATVNDSYEADALTVDIWLNGENIPVRAEILWADRRILSVEVENCDIA